MFHCSPMSFFCQTAKKEIAYKKQAFSSLKSSQYHDLKNTYNAISDPIVVADFQGIILLVNCAASVVFGFDESEMLGQNVTMLMPEKYARSHGEKMGNFHISQENRQSKKPRSIRPIPHQFILGKSRRLEAKKSDGSCFPIELVLTRLKLKKQNKEVFVGQFHDITSQVEKQLLGEENLRFHFDLEVSRKLKKKEEFLLGYLSHEMRNALNALSTSYEELDHLLKSDLRREIANHSLCETLFFQMEESQGSLDYMKLILGNILDIRKAEQRKLSINPTKIYINEIIDKVQEHAVHILKHKKRLTFRSQWIDTDDCIHTDFEKIVQLIVNLLHFLCRSTDDGELALEVSVLHTKTVCFCLRSSQGDLSKAANILRSFKSLDERQLSDVQGSSLELYLASLLSKLLSIGLCVDNNSCFNFSLPLSSFEEGSTIHGNFSGFYPLNSASTPSYAFRESPQSRDLDASGFQIIHELPPHLVSHYTPAWVVDDNFVNRKQLGQILENMGLKVDTLADGDEVVPLMEQKIEEGKELPRGCLKI